MTRWTRFAGILLGFALVLGTDYLRLAPINLDWLRQCRDEAVLAVASPGVQKAELLCLSAYLVGFIFMLRSLRKNSKANVTGSRSARNVRTSRSACLLCFCGVSLL